MGQKNPAKFPPNFPPNFPNFHAKNQKQSPTSFCRSAGRRFRINYVMISASMVDRKREREATQAAAAAAPDAAEHEHEDGPQCLQLSH